MGKERRQQNHAEPPAFSQLLVALAPFASGESNSHNFSHVYLWGREFECIKTAAHIPHPLRRFAVVLPEPQDFRRCKAHIFNKINKRLICLALFDNGWSFLIQSFDHPVRRATWMFLHQPGDLMNQWTRPWSIRGKTWSSGGRLSRAWL